MTALYNGASDSVRDDDEELELYHLTPAAYGVVAVDNAPSWVLESRKLYQQVHSEGHPIFKSSEYMDAESSMNIEIERLLGQDSMNGGASEQVMLESRVVAIMGSRLNPAMIYRERGDYFVTFHENIIEDIPIPVSPPPIIVRNTIRPEGSSIEIRQQDLIKSFEEHIVILTDLCSGLKTSFQQLDQNLKSIMELQIERQRKLRGLPIKIISACSICLVRNSDRVLLPCCHLACCSICSMKLYNCPVCRKSCKRKLLIQMNS